MSTASGAATRSVERDDGRRSHILASQAGRPEVEDGVEKRLDGQPLTVDDGKPGAVLRNLLPEEGQIPIATHPE